MGLIEKMAKKYKTPSQVQKFLRQFDYNREKRGQTLRSAESALQKKTAHCFEAAFIAAALLELNGYPPLVLSFESQDGLDHVIFVYKTSAGKWGSVARSRDEGLHGRRPQFKTLRDLTWSYFDPYIDKTGKITAYQLAHLDDTRTNWRRSTRSVWAAEKYLLKLKHIRLRSSSRRYKKVHQNFLNNGPLLKGVGWL